MKVPRSAGVETMAPDAHAPLGLRNMVTSCGGLPGSTSYPCIDGVGNEILRVGKVVCLSPAGPKTSVDRSWPNARSVTRCAISPTTMLSVFEYSYREPGVNARPFLPTHPIIRIGDTYPRGSVIACVR